MKVVQVHNYYQNRGGGEDYVVDEERRLLEQNGYEVIPFYKTNDEIRQQQESWSGSGKLTGKFMRFFHMANVACKTVWNRRIYHEFLELLKEQKPDVVHCHNTFPIISPALYWACAKMRVPVVQTVHNYRLMCLNAFLYRLPSEKPSGSEGFVCEDCLMKKFKWPGVVHACYRDSRLTSLVLAVMLLVHRWIGTWRCKVSLYIALTGFQRQKMIQGGFPEHKIAVKPNFVAPPEVEHACPASEDLRNVPMSDPFALFAGKLVHEKGALFLMEAWIAFKRGLKNGSAESPFRLIIAGDGPCLSMMKEVLEKSGVKESVVFCGRISQPDVFFLMEKASFLIFPSLWYEGMPMTIVQSFACGTPVLASNTGAMCSMIENGQTGFLFEESRSAGLADRIEWMFSHAKECEQMGRNACEVYEKEYTPEQNFNMMEQMYTMASQMSD